jgi:hypothetical protein
MLTADTTTLEGTISGRVVLPGDRAWDIDPADVLKANHHVPPAA